jgi:outer membrane protein assembly factor BamB
LVKARAYVLAVQFGRHLAALACVLAFVTGACGGGDDDGADATATASSTSTARPVPDGAPAEYARYPTDWVLPGRDYGNSRATHDSTITSENVEDLDVAWEARLDGALSTVPLIVGDTIYVQDGSGRITALDLDGKPRWATEPYGTMIGPYGVAVADGRVFGLHGTTGVVAVDATNGDELWVRDITTTPSAGVDIQPLVFDGTVFVSTVPISFGGIYKGGDRGIIHALDAATGEVRWTFDTVKGDDLWGNADVNSGGGAWYPPAVDAPRGALYWGIANPAPFPGTAEFPNGTSRPGANLYTDAAVTLDVGTGKLRWYHQAVPHDLFDRDLVHTMLVRDDGADVVVATGKGGVVFGLDPETGERRWETPVGVHRNDDLDALTGPTEVWPGTYGGVLTPPAHADGIVYVATVNAPTTLKPDETSYFGSELGTSDGEVVAIGADDGKVRWSTKVPGDPLGGAAVVNDLVLTGLLEGKVVALDRDNGDIVWEHDAPGGINGWMSAAGDLLVVPVSNADPPRLVAYRAR